MSENIVTFTKINDKVFVVKERVIAVEEDGNDGVIVTLDNGKIAYIRGATAIEVMGKLTNREGKNFEVVAEDKLSNDEDRCLSCGSRIRPDRGR